MKNIRFLILTIGTLASLGGPILDSVAADTSAVKMSLSANENYLRRFRKEREALSSATDADAVKKREALDKKIKNLEMENERLASMLQKNGQTVKKAVPAPVQPAASAPVQEPAAAAQAEVLPPAPQRVATPPPASSARPFGAAVVEWEKMNREEKESYILKIVTGLKKDGYPVERHPLFYTALMDYVFVSDAVLAAKPLKEAVLATIQKNESSWRALQKN
jgi:hypothetical protein